MRKNVSSKKKSVWNSQKPPSYPLNKKLETSLKTKLMLNKKTTKELRNKQESNMAVKELVLLVPQTAAEANKAEVAPVELVLEFMAVTKEAEEGIKLNQNTN